MNPRLVLALALASAPLAAAAQNLNQVYLDARLYDAQYAAAKYALQAGQEKLPQGRALLLPTLSLNASVVQTTSIPISTGRRRSPPAGGITAPTAIRSRSRSRSTARRTTPNTTRASCR
jgi:outer membrane protein TolC